MRNRIARICVTLAASLAISSMFTMWASSTVRDPDRFAPLVAKAVTSDAFSGSLRLTVGSAGPGQPVIESLADRLDDPELTDRVEAGLITAHGTVFDDEGTDTERATAIRTAIAGSIAGDDSTIRPHVDQALTTLVPDDGVGKLSGTMRAVGATGPLPLFAAVALGSTAIVVGSRRQLVIRRLGLAVGIPAAAVVFLISAGPGLVFGLIGITDADLRVLVDALLDPLARTAALFATAAAGTVIVNEVVHLAGRAGARKLASGRQNRADKPARPPKPRKDKKRRSGRPAAPAAGGGWIGGPVDDPQVPDPLSGFGPGAAPGAGWRPDPQPTQPPPAGSAGGAWTTGWDPSGGLDPADDPFGGT